MTCAWMAAGLLLSCLVSADPTGPLEGSWEIISVIDNGEVQPSRVVFEKFAEDGRLSVKGNVIRCKNPGHKELQEMACVVDTTKNPNTIDLAGAERVNTKGIFSVQGDMLTLCFGSPDVVTRPDRFSAAVGSKRLLIMLHRVPDLTPPMTPILEQPSAIAAPQPVRQPPPPQVALVPVVPVPEPVMLNRDKIVGTWGHQDEQKISYTTFNPDGTFSALTTYKNGFQKVFHIEDRRSGTWNLSEGVIALRYTASTDKKDVNQVYSMRIQRVADTDMIYRDAQGMERIEWRVR